MYKHPIANSSMALLLIEACLILVALFVAYGWPWIGAQGFSRIERAFGSLAREKNLAVFTVGASMLLLRLAILPWCPAPQPFIADDFSFLLAADTFAHGRLANPTPAMWTHLESIHITMHPTYMSMYFPGPGLLMAAGKIVFGHPWAAILITGALSCAALCWMLQAWLPPTWALLGGFIAVIRIGLFSYWVNSYSGGATLTILGGALVLGAFPRLIRTGRFRHGMLLAAGICLLAITRPYEGVLLCLPVAVRLAHWIFFGAGRPSIHVLARRALAPILLLAGVLVWLGYYDYRAFGKPTTLPYTLDRVQYAVVPYYIWQKPQVEPVYRNAEMRKFYTRFETIGPNEARTPRGFFRHNVAKANTALMFFSGMLFVPLLFMVPRVLKDRRTRFFVLASPFWIAGMFIGVFLVPHYLAPFTAAVYALGLQAMRHLRAWKPAGQPVGRAMVRFTVVIAILLAAVRVNARPLQLLPPEWPMAPWISTWVGPGNYGAPRAAILSELKKLPGKHLVLVRYGEHHEPGDEWVYNEADVDGSRVVWAREIDPASDLELMHYYGDRDVWLVQPDVGQGTLTPYSRPGELHAAALPVHGNSQNEGSAQHPNPE